MTDYETKYRDALVRIERLAQAHAVTARARGRSEVERDWLDVCTITERALLASSPVEGEGKGRASERIIARAAAEGHCTSHVEFEPSCSWCTIARDDLNRAAPAPVSSGEAGGPEEHTRAGWDRCKTCGFGGWYGSRWHNPPYGAHYHCDNPEHAAKCQPCSVGDGFHRSSPHSPAEHEACDCAHPSPVATPNTEGDQ